MVKFFDVIIFAVLVAMFSFACAIHSKAKKAEYEYYVLAKHLVVHQLDQEDCVYIKAEENR